MKCKPTRVILIEDNPGDARLIRESLVRTNAAFELQVADTLATGLALLESGAFDVLLLDLELPDSQGLQTLVRVHAQEPGVPIIVLTILDDEILGVRAVQAGAQDYLVKGNLADNILVRTLRYAIERHQLLAEIEHHSQELRASEARTRRIIQMNADAILIVNKLGTVRFANSAAESLFGRKVKQLLDEPFSYPVEAGKTTELDIVRREQQPVTAEMRVVAIEWMGEAVFLASLRDVTERKKVESALERSNEQLRRTNEDLEQFAYVASHDLREPLNMVSSYLQLLQRRYQGQLDSDADEFIQIAVNNADRMKMLIADLLTYARVGTIGHGFKPTDCDIVLEQAVTNLQVKIENSSAEVTFDPLPSVMGDAVQLTQVFQILIGNALKFHNEQPPIVHISAEKTATLWTFSIQDYGIGLDPRFAERIFTIFERLHTREEYSGTGMGLAVSKKIVGRHGGRIWVKSEIGKGATFYFTLPVLAEQKNGD